MVSFYSKVIASLIKRNQSWKQNCYNKKKDVFERLVAQGQKPNLMIISCCDSRINPMEMFEADIGECFVHRNIANLVPEYAEKEKCHGTIAAIEYAVLALKVENIVVLGHSNCGGALACISQFKNKKATKIATLPSVEKWLEILRPKYNQLPKNLSDTEKAKMLERLSVGVSIDNLLSYPFIKDAVMAKKLSLHGLWIDIGKGELLVFDKDTGNVRNL